MRAIQPPTLIDAWGVALSRGLASWWFMVHLGALVLVVGLSPSTYNRANRRNFYQHIYVGTLDALPWFTAMSALISLVLIRVVVVTAQSYGLSQYALEMVVRVLVLELIPLSAAMFIALRAGMAPYPGPLADRPAGTPGLAQLQADWAPLVVARIFSVVTLATVSSMLALALTYLTVHGFSPWGLPGYTRTVGQVFNLPVTLGFGLKIIFFSLAVAIVPMAARLEVRHGNPVNPLQPGAIRLFLVLLWIEAASLSAKYI